jgi:tetratricopeptide (TPR) repeat protein
VFESPSRSSSAIEYYARALGAAREDKMSGAVRLANESTASDSRFRQAQLLLAQIELRIGAFRSAGPRLHALAVQAKQDGDPIERSEIELRLSLLSQIQGAFEAAMIRAQTALSLSLEHGDLYGQIAALDLICDLHMTREPPPGEKLDEKALEKHKDANVVKAVESQQLLVDMLDFLGDRISSIAATNKLALLYERQDKLDAALRLHRRTLSLAQELESAHHEATAWLFIGQCHRKQKSWSEAIDAINRCLGLVEKVARPGVQLVLGGVYLDMGKPENAIKHFDAACELLQGTDDLLNQISCLREGARARMRLGRRDEAIARLQQAIDLAHALELPEEAALVAEIEKWRGDKK